jgi:hypothetical protein
MLALCWKVKQGLSSGGDLGLSEHAARSTDHLRPHDIAEPLVCEFLRQPTLALGLGGIARDALALSGGHLLKAWAARGKDHHTADQRD